VAGAGRQADAEAVVKFVAALGIVWLVVCGNTPAFAHASLAASEPRDGAVLASAPKQIQLHFNEKVTAGAIHLIDAAGKLRDDASVDAKDETIAVTVPAGLPQGTSIVSYRVISADGHPVAGSIAFSVGAPTATNLPDVANPVINGLIWLTRIGLYLGLFGGIGGAFFCSWIARERAASSPISAALVTGIAGAVGSLGLQGLDLLGLPLSSLATAAPWTIALGTSLGPSLLIAIAALGLGIAATRCRAGRALSAIALLGVGLSLAASGHAATAPPQVLTRPAMFLHGVAIAFWLGALAPLIALLWSRKGAALPIVNRFSTVAVPVVAVLALTGLTLAVIELERLGALVTTRYGIILSIKLVLVAILLGLAALNRFRFTPALARGDAKPLSRSILLECVVALGILAVVAGWRFTPPPRSLVPDAPLAVHIHTDKAMFQVLITPGRVGTDSFVLQLLNGDGSLLQAKEATLTLSIPSRGIEEIERPATRSADGFWRVDNVPLAVPGRWHMRIDALVTDFEKITLEDDFDVATQ
jgi:copper transport protein